MTPVRPQVATAYNLVLHNFQELDRVRKIATLVGIISSAFSTRFAIASFCIAGALYYASYKCKQIIGHLVTASDTIGKSRNQWIAQQKENAKLINKSRETNQRLRNQLRQRNEISVLNLLLFSRPY